MKALLYKDSRILWRIGKLYLLMIAIFCLVPSDSVRFLRLFFVVYSAMLPITLLSFDERSRWIRLADMLPYRRQDIVLSKYLMGWILALAAGLFLLAGCALGRFPPSDSLGMLASAWTGTLLVQAVSYPLLFRFGVERGRLAMSLAIAVTCGIAAGASVAGTGPAGSPLLSSAPVVLPFALVLCLASVPLSVRWYGRREH